MESLSRHTFGRLERAAVEAERAALYLVETLLLTQAGPLATFDTVSILAKTTSFSVRRAVSVATLLFVFFLPLHFHFSLTTQVSKECSCVHGTRTKLVPHDDSAGTAPILPVTMVAARYEFSWAGDWSTLQKVRGPPLPLSV
jgi:hypothetical protein